MEYIILIVALAAIVYGADILVSGSVAIARRLHVSDFIVGALIVGIGTSMPEMTVSVIGAIRGNADIAIGNVVGSNIVNILGILGITAAIFPIAVTKSNLRFELPLCISVSVLLLLLNYNFFNGSPAVLGRADGIILLALFAAFIVFSFMTDRKKPVHEKDKQVKDNSPLWPAVTKVIGGLVILIAGSHFFVEEAIAVARKLGVNDAFISITLVACGTSVPEFAASIAAAAKKSTQLALGNIIGSNIFNILLILGLSATITPLETGGITIVDYLVMIAAAVLPVLYGIRGKISRAGGFFMLLCFIAYNIWLIIN